MYESFAYGIIPGKYYSYYLVLHLLFMLSPGSVPCSICEAIVTARHNFYVQLYLDRRVSAMHGVTRMRSLVQSSSIPDMICNYACTSPGRTPRPEISLAQMSGGGLV